MENQTKNAEMIKAVIDSAIEVAKPQPLVAFVLQEIYYTDRAKIVWRGYRTALGVGRGATTMLLFDVINEQNKVCGSFEISEEKAKRREDITVLAKDLV